VTIQSPMSDSVSQRHDANPTRRRHRLLWRLHDREGFLLLLSYFLVLLTAVAGSVLFSRSANEQQQAVRSQALSSAFQMAESGLDAAAAWLRALPSPPTGTNSMCPFAGIPYPGCTATAMNQGSYTVTVTPDPNNPNSYTHLYTMTSVGKMTSDPTVRPQLVAKLRATSFAKYAYFTNSERQSNGSPIWFTTNDHMQGPVHTNDRFNIAGSPIFDSQISSVASTINYRSPAPAGGNHPQFNGGTALGVSAIQIPLSATALRVAASSLSGQWYQGNTTFQLQAVGTMLVTNAALGWVNHSTSLPTNGAVFVNGGSATVSGTIKGQVTLGASSDINVTNNLLCATDPQTNPNSSDILGLLAEQNVVISQSAPYNLQLQASVMALNSSFTVANWWVGPPKGTLNVYGGIIQVQRGPVGTFSGTTGQKLSGYSKSYQYDSRFSNLAPPYFPTTGSYQQVLWQQTN